MNSRLLKCLTLVISTISCFAISNVGKKDVNTNSLEQYGFVTYENITYIKVTSNYEIKEEQIEYHLNDKKGIEIEGSYSYASVVDTYAVDDLYYSILYINDEYEDNRGSSFGKEIYNLVLNVGGEDLTCTISFGQDDYKFTVQSNNEYLVLLLDENISVTDIDMTLIDFSDDMRLETNILLESYKVNENQYQIPISSIDETTTTSLESFDALEIEINNGAYYLSSPIDFNEYFNQEEINNDQILIIGLSVGIPVTVLLSTIMFVFIYKKIGK